MTTVASYNGCFPYPIGHHRCALRTVVEIMPRVVCSSISVVDCSAVSNPFRLTVMFIALALLVSARSMSTYVVSTPVPSAFTSTIGRTDATRAPDHDSMPILWMMPALATSMPQSHPKELAGFRIWLKACG